MLNKSVCKYCCTFKTDVKWNKTDENHWKKQQVFCSCYGYRSITRQPPKQCPYILEHMVSEKGV